MDPETPILMITLQIPVTPDTSVNEVLDAIGERVAQALEEARQQQLQPRPLEEDLEAIALAEFKASLVHETEERFTENTHEDLLVRLGYTAA